MKICTVSACGRPHQAKGYCSKHYDDVKRTGRPQEVAYETHGKRNSVEYNAWRNMKQRCYDKNYRNFKYWGGRGITVCASWRGSFKDFYRDLGSKPSPELTLDRIDNDGNYEPGNVRWADRTTQSTNQRPKWNSRLRSTS